MAFSTGFAQIEERLMPAKDHRDMARTSTPDTPRGPAADDRYLDLVRRFPLRPIRSEAELDRAIAMIDSLVDQETLSLDEQDYLDVLSDIVEKYETETHPLP